MAFAVDQRIDFIEAFVPLLFDSCLTGETGSLDVLWVQVTIADNLDGIDGFELLMDQFEGGRAEIAGDPAV